MDTATYSLIITIAFNIILLTLVLVSFSLIRAFRGDKEKVKPRKGRVKKGEFKITDEDQIL